MIDPPGDVHEDLIGAVRLRSLKAKLLGTPEHPLRLGRFAIERVIGRGAMGVVFLAHDDRLDRPVAIKLLRRDDSTASARLEREARALARLTHPHVVTIHEVGEHDGRTFIAMEYVPGQDLRTWMATPRPLAARIAVIRQLAEGLAAAHAIGVVHRDFKPHNAIVGDDQRVRIVDFGLAIMGPAGHGIDAQDQTTLPGDVLDCVTATGAVLGTPAYMAPEQLRGGAATIASDQFALCCVGWELLFGRHPFVDRARDDPPALPADAPRVLGRALARGLAPDPATRHPSVVPIVEACAHPPRRGLRVAVVAALGVGILGLWWMLRAPSHTAAPSTIATDRSATECAPSLDVTASRRTLLSNLEGATAERAGATDPVSRARATFRAARFALELGQWSTGCAHLTELGAGGSLADEAACWHRHLCTSAAALPPRSRCFGGDVEQCRTAAIPHEYEYLDSKRALLDGDDPATAASMQLHLAYWTELMDTACSFGDAASCEALARSLDDRP